MKLIYNGKKYQIFSRVPIPKKRGEYVYFLRIGKSSARLYKIGTTNDILRRMIEHCRYYGEEIYILWVSPNYSKYTTLRVEDRTRESWKEIGGFIYQKNDRFYIDSSIDKVQIKVKKIYEVALE